MNNTDKSRIIIDTTFDVRSDTPPKKDPDSASPTLWKYHRLLWSKPLPNGQMLELSDKLMGIVNGNEYWFSGDTIIHTFSTWVKTQHIIKQIPSSVIQDFLTTAYTIGGNIIFPANVADRHQMTMNQRRGCLVKICDRFDLTLECIRRYYRGEDSPLYSCVKSWGPFFDAFVDFKGYVDFFLLQDLVSEDYSKVEFWYPFPGEFYSNPLPKNPEEYLKYVATVTEFVHKRNARISDWAAKNL